MAPGENATVETRPTEAQPLPAAAPLTEPSGSRGVSETPRRDPQRPTCPRCGLPVPESRPEPASQPRSRPQGDRSRSKRSDPGPDRPAPGSADWCWGLLLACLWCRFSAVLLGLLEACCSSSCLQGLCSSCCCASCARCGGAAVRDAPGEEPGCPARCRSVLFESCCEPVQFLEFCLDCCEICHRG